MITNPKIERKKSDIARTETLLAEVRAKLRNQKQELIKFEDEEIVARFRREILNEDEYKSLMRSRQENENNSDVEDDSLNGRTLNSQERKGESTDALSEN